MTRAGAATTAARGGATAERPVEDPLDLRLAVGAVLAWVAVLLCVDAGPRRAAGVAVLAAVGGGVLLLLHRVRWASGAALALFAVALVCFPLAARIAAAAQGPLQQLVRAHAAVDLAATVSADPRTLAATGVSGVARVAVEVDVDSVVTRGRDMSTDSDALVLGDARAWRDVLPGQRVRLSGTLQPDLSGGRLSVTVFERGPPQLVGRPPWWQRGAARVRAGLRGAASVLPEQERGLLPGLVDSDTSALDPVLAERFRLAGLTHLVAVSGTNCSLLLGAVLLTARRLRARRSVQVALGVVVLAVFVVVARPSPSVLRAAVMALIALAALASGRPRSAVPGLAAATLVLLAWQPVLAGSASFVMSVLATAALLLLAPGWARRLRARRVPPVFAESIAVAAAAHVVTAPVVAAISGRVSLVAVFANVLAEPVVAVVTVLGFGAAVLAPLWLPAGQVLAWCAGWPCRWLVHVADVFGGLTGATIPWPGGALGGLALLAILLLVAAIAVRAGARRALTAMAITALVLLIPVRSVVSMWPPDGWVFAACDVGQGDALLLPAGPGAAVEIDTGPDPVAVDRCLREFGISHLTTLVLTHDHIDHVGGLSGAVRGRSVGRILVGPLADPPAGAELVRRTAERLHLPVVTPAPGSSFTDGDTRVDVLGPAAVLHGTRSDPNNSSLVLRATVRGVRILLPGDAELEEQREILSSGVDLRADILKIPHHGSAYSIPEFLAAAHATAAVVSVGEHNDYGHPSPLLLAAVARLGVPLLRTDRDGDVAFTGTPGHIRAVTHGVQASTAAGAPVRPRSAASVGGARMSSCRPAQSASTTSPSRWLPSTCSSATRSCSSIAPSPRCRPPPAATTPRLSRPP